MKLPPEVIVFVLLWIKISKINVHPGAVVAGVLPGLLIQTTDGHHLAVVDPVRYGVTPRISAGVHQVCSGGHPGPASRLDTGWGPGAHVPLGSS